MLQAASHKTPVGNLYLIADEQVLLAAGFNSLDYLISKLSSEDIVRDIKNVRSISKISELILDYFDGDLAAINAIEVRQPGAKFSQNVWKSLRKIPVGKTWSYAELAKRAGSDDAVRAAGTACGNNLIAPIIPCHRVVKSGGALGNYGYGVKIKEWLLRHEGALK
ncbi:MAG: methylated-DNA--[protein]-cysteine S-methyltransferase [Actinobacteria bacterium]|jgi:methylated-DNA-[protein]-cysteine S-methyltransferase|uniref:methylated-DNA--[protein]-cysteine S-methyltransferase n=1 Tax=freshwater metagenome TaxID=449393 RepID=A0A6J6CL46_9ZZZZ|nr:methylated-DNA--[protein]-cysteine S-methyltransferase [Actinomycetota bacterium]MSV65281.1 methylated-DNA--[protein]-cysteine S-methyltransferase [Actinomycetota bacterium]MSX69230.1 methylated-DNA--[protein]-cysteine S-methyltransferase [Actinomycetota bacterium]MSY16126.1 methylated-DNA--[protein]-cysteine S-methyltransferase [Actinomycetota bacterium]MSY64513.1 methylated-DNA--[protein]-cysteine S-methyltransferase [Actinomycetota bacterium]